MTDTLRQYTNNAVNKVIIGGTTVEQYSYDANNYLATITDGEATPKTVATSPGRYSKLFREHKGQVCGSIPGTDRVGICNAGLKCVADICRVI